MSQEVQTPQEIIEDFNELTRSKENILNELNCLR
jgi:hypothetical protein